MSRRFSAASLTGLIVLINTLLMLFGLVAYRYHDTWKTAPDWMPVPRPAAVDPFLTYRRPLA